MTRRKYRFPNRAEAEEAYVQANQEQLAAGLFATAILQNRIKLVGVLKDNHPVHVGYFVGLYNAYVFAYVDDASSAYVIKGVWDAQDDDLTLVIAGLSRSEYTHEFGTLLNNAMQAAHKELLAV